MSLPQVSAMRGDDDDIDIGEDYGYDDERERIEREAIADFKDSRIHVIKSFMEDAQKDLGAFGDDAIAAAKRALEAEPPDTVAAVAHAFRVMETYGKVVPRDAILRVLMEPISHLFDSPPDPRAVINDRYVAELRDAVLNDFWMGPDLVPLFTQFFSKARVKMRNKTVHGYYRPTVVEAREAVAVAESAYAGVKKMIGPCEPSSEDPGF